MSGETGSIWKGQREWKCYGLGFWFFGCFWVFFQTSVIPLLFITNNPFCFSDNNYKCICSMMKVVWFGSKKFSTRNNPCCAQNLPSKARSRPQKELPEQKLVNQILLLIWACCSAPQSRLVSRQLYIQVSSLALALMFLCFTGDPKGFTSVTWSVFWSAHCVGVPETPQEKWQECVTGEGYAAVVPT